MNLNFRWGGYAEIQCHVNSDNPSAEEEKSECNIVNWSRNYLDNVFKFEGRCTNDFGDGNTGKWTAMMLTLVSATDGTINLDLDNEGNWKYDDDNGLTDNEYGLEANRNTFLCSSSGNTDSAEINWELVVF